MEIAIVLLILTIASIITTRVESDAIVWNLQGIPEDGYAIQAMVGTPPQKLNVVIDTGSSNFAIAAAPHPYINTYFSMANSTTLIDYSATTSTRYTQGIWTAQMASDLVYFPTLNSVPEVRCDIGFITEADRFYINGSNWQGILGIAYSILSKPNPHTFSWLDSLQDNSNDHTFAFSLILCGAPETDINRHYGSFEILNNVVHSFEGLHVAPTVKDWYYEVTLVGITVGNASLDADCRDLNQDKSIVDSGTTNLHLPTKVFNKLIDVLMGSPALSSVPLQFWLRRAPLCVASRADLPPWPDIGLKLAAANQQYFVLNLPGQSYIRRSSVKTSTSKGKSEHCFKFGIEESRSGSVLGVAVMEGLQVIFNRSAHNVGFRSVACGPNVTITGPFFSNDSQLDYFKDCSCSSYVHTSMLQIGAYIVCVALLLAALMFLFLFVQWLLDKYGKLYSVQQSGFQLSSATLINEET